MVVFLVREGQGRGGGEGDCRSNLLTGREIIDYHTVAADDVQSLASGK
jgi:hypothetical protein